MQLPWVLAVKEEDATVTVAVDTINLSVRDLVRQVNAAVDKHPRLSQLRLGGALEAVDVDVAQGGSGSHVLKVRGAEDYLVHLDRPVVAFQSVFTPLMLYLGNVADNEYDGHLLIPRLEVSACRACTRALLE
jgi:hypothetical protein